MEKGKKPKLEYSCLKCGTVSKHRAMGSGKAFCSKCQKQTKHRLLSLPGIEKPAAETVKKGKVSVEHVPETIVAEPIPSAEGEGEWKGDEIPLIGGAGSAEDWADIYGMPAETISLILKDPSLNLSDEACKLQGMRIARYCERHHIVMPDWFDLIPIVSRAARDYGELIFKALSRAKEELEKKKEKKASKEVVEPEVVVPESTVEHISEPRPDQVAKVIEKKLGGSTGANST